SPFNSWILFQRLDAQRSVVEERLNPPAAQRRIDSLAGLVETGNRNQLRVERFTEDACCIIAVDAGERPPAQRAVNMDVAARDELGAGTDGRDDNEVAALGKDLLPRANRLGDE